MTQAAMAIIVGLFAAASVYLILSRSMVRVLLGVVLLGNGVNLLILAAGRIAHVTPPVLAAGQTVLSVAANPLPQALILTAIVIGFALFAFLAVLIFRTYEEFSVDDADQLRVAEPPGGPAPSLEY